MESRGPEDERLTAINDRLDELDPATFESKARKVLSGLGFHETMTGNSHLLGRRA
jgi:ATP-binding cassette subfamily F protein 2|eukprot:COSAG01_NODE_36950_length_510_cov_1.248175_1_plen_55_part_00